VIGIPEGFELVTVTPSKEQLERGVILIVNDISAFLQGLPHAVVAYALRQDFAEEWCRKA
jgi:hypothetical protein